MKRTGYTRPGRRVRPEAVVGDAGDSAASCGSSRLPDRIHLAVVGRIAAAGHGAMLIARTARHRFGDGGIRPFA